MNLRTFLSIGIGMSVAGLMGVVLFNPDFMLDEVFKLAWNETRKLAFGMMFIGIIILLFVAVIDGINMLFNRKKR